ncbi:MAG: hypothetical protein F6K39_04480, partial [Okeania sp. SIO3B3]|nr:hypothetical protein [Okeania sp. SIO3B3]
GKLGELVLRISKIFCLFFPILLIVNGQVSYWSINPYIRAIIRVSSLRIHQKFKGLVLPCLNSAIASSASWASWS